MDMTTLIGVLGASLILSAFVGGELKRFTSESVWYDILNMLGSAALLYYAYLLDSWPFMLLNAVWLLFAAKDMVRRIL